MIRVSSTVNISAPVETVFAWMDQPGQLAALSPLPTTILESWRLPNGGWFGRMLVDDPKGGIELLEEVFAHAHLRARYASLASCLRACATRDGPHRERGSDATEPESAPTFSERPRPGSGLPGALVGV